MQGAGQHNGGGQHGVADTLFDGARFAGQHMLIDRRRAGLDNAIHWNQLTGPHNDQITNGQRVQWALYFLSIHQRPDL